LNAPPPPRLSVLIASHRRRSLLERCLRSFEAQTQPLEDFEVIVADDGSDDGTAELAEALGTPLRLRVLRLEKMGKPAALNAAIDVAAGDACLFVDDDIVASPGLVGEHLAAHRENPDTLGIGALTQSPPSRRDPYAESYARRWNARYEALQGAVVDWADCYGGNFSAPRGRLLEVGGFDAELPAIEDLELGFRLQQAGCAVRFLPGAAAVHDDEKPGARILADEVRFGGFCASFAREHPVAQGRLLGWYNEPTLREILLRRLFLSLRLPPSLLVSAGRLLPRARRDLWFGFVSRYAIWHGARAAMDRGQWRQTTRGIPVLMYHAFTATGERDRFVMSKRSFLLQMLLLKFLRYRVIGLAELARLLREGRPLPQRRAVITIDDGYRDVVEVAYPILRRLRIPATVFLVSERIGAENDWDDIGAVSGRALLSLEEIERMRAGGVEFGAHTRTHRSLVAAGDDELPDQISGSRRDLEQLLGEQVPTLTFPYGHHDRRTAPASADAGYEAACTTVARAAQRGDDPLLIPRIEIGGSDSPLRFLRKLWIAGD
jgi:glycosyltransferase involved in cell wall biosynthesis/peptidoglycan/xylan/chitin deacetylase (PgdA/CDA1 family)